MSGRVINHHPSEATLAAYAAGTLPATPARSSPQPISADARLPSVAGHPGGHRRCAA